MFPSLLQLPYFMNELTLTELDMGVAVPKILQAFKPYVDHQGNSSRELTVCAQVEMSPSLQVDHRSFVLGGGRGQFKHLSYVDYLLLGTVTAFN